MLPINSRIIIIIIHPLNVASVAQDYEHYQTVRNALFNIELGSIVKKKQQQKTSKTERQGDCEAIMRLSWKSRCSKRK